MGKIIYEPKKRTSQKEVKVILNTVKRHEDPKKSVETKDFTEQRYNALIENIDSVRPVGDTECEYVVYLEDYVYTYIYQYASTDLEREHSAIVLGEFYPETKEVIVCGIVPVSKDKLDGENEWVNQTAINDAIEERDKYFKEASILGWMHMQPGYGTMLTMKEVKIHRDLFDRGGSLLLLLDPINRIENFYIYEDDNLKEQSGYYIYYDKNACMQQYMLEHPFVVQEKEQLDDTVVNQFREIGRKRKKEYEQRKKLNFTVAASALTLLAMAAVITKMSDQRSEIQGIRKNLTEVSAQASTNNRDVEEEVKFTIQPNGDINQESTQENTQVGNADQVPEEIIDVNSDEIQFIDNTNENSQANTQEQKTLEEVAELKKEDNLDEQTQVAIKEEIKEETKEEVKEEVKEEIKEEVKQEAKEEIKEETEQVSNVQEEVTGAEYVSYVVQEGDTLRKISYDHYQTEGRARDIVKLNEIDDGDQIYVGQKIKIPAE